MVYGGSVESSNDCKRWVDVFLRRPLSLSIDVRDKHFKHFYGKQNIAKGTADYAVCNVARFLYEADQEAKQHCIKRLVTNRVEEFLNINGPSCNR